MMNFCTLGDKNYLLKGLALYQSLCNVIKGDFILNWLCMDHTTLVKLEDLKKRHVYFNKIKTHSLISLEYGSYELREAKKNPPSKWGTQYSQYCWCLTPWFMNYMLQRTNRNEYLMYVDNDIYFYQSPQVIIDAMNDKSIGIHTHRFSTMEERENGNYNVGVVVFKSDDPISMDISIKWKQWLLNPTNKYYEKYGTCGDQKYLELFEPIAGKEHVSVFDVEGDLLHYAPWCTHNPKNQHPVLFHFSHFTFDIEKNTWSDSVDGEWKPAQDPGMSTYYQNYWETIFNMSKFF